MDQRVLSANDATQLRQGIGWLLSRWSAIQMAVDKEWGSSDSRQIAQQLALDIFYLEPASPIRTLPFYIVDDHKPPIYDDSCWLWRLLSSSVVLNVPSHGFQLPICHTGAA
ncbi:hypothetical protein RJ639_045566 [Escallonia herrerae]|uniref:Uncharacterized protein n=1 Tax=Escallonia herrerae TaxID=1293975 RepID=A0AA88W7U3_9ASTE|nr:hypothetical protein RJ639_045566 [Escallonia herrerae]